jgi:hypothetical protein
MASVPLRHLITLIVADARRAHQGDYAYAQQTAMAVSVLFTALSDRGDAAVTPQLRGAVAALYAQVHDRDRFSIGAYTASLDRLAGTLGVSPAAGSQAPAAGPRPSAMVKFRP